MSVFRLTMLPANEGDSLILSYGESDAEGALRHVLIDGGRKASWPHLEKALTAIKDRGEAIELMVLSHIDADHIDGLLAMAQATAVPLVPKAVWYNGYAQLAQVPLGAGPQAYGFPAAESYSLALEEKGWDANVAFGGKPLAVEGQRQPIDIADLSVTLVSPDREKLRVLRSEWDQWRSTRPGVRALAKRPMPKTLDVDALSAPSKEDTSAPNGSSIAFVARYKGRSVLLGADAHPDTLLASLERLAGEDGTFAVDLIKLPHHGSRANLTREVVEKLDCRRFAISTSGAVFGHPDPEAIARLLKFGKPGIKTLYFNYAGERTTPWGDATLKERWSYECVYPPSDMAPLVIDI
ncbi:ComEC/Rec2 family competence protein [Muricoccus pecuniae]|uniref:Metallo-beta-lactamase domain-containing protein n=1 Tax=Muricoccus pecuniae TaxID=693023 RepID=A0A840YHT3_9PROT|nr:MBL fold metallo-hydrolase [Roseomonas pecuniae]MBB5695981.1 hypothetical protein [Roseomonas pecuniae]